MSRKNFLNIYKRNAWGILSEWPLTAWLGRDIDIGSVILPVVIVWVVYATLLPLTLTIGAGIKSLLDYFTRKDLPEEQLSSLKEKINDSEDAVISSLVDTISRYHPQSKSSQALIADLKKVPDEEAQIVTRHFIAKKRELQCDQCSQYGQCGQCNLSLREDKIIRVTLDKSHLSQLNQYDDAERERCEKEEMNKEKGLIQSYLADPNNAGKKMQHEIYHFFSNATLNQAGNTKQFESQPTFTVDV